MHSARREARRRPDRLRRGAGILVALAISVAAAAPSALAAGEMLVYDPDPFQSNLAINEGYFNFAQAAGRTKIESTTLPATDAEWDSYECVVLPVVRRTMPLPAQGFTLAERTAIMNYAARGGTVVALAEHQNADPGQVVGPETVTTFNSLASGTGIQALNTSRNGGPTYVTKGGVPGTPDDIDHMPASPPQYTSVNFTEGVNRVGFAAATTLTVTAPAFPLVYTKWVEVVDPAPAVFMAMRMWGAGKFVYSGDSNVFSDGAGGYYSGTDNGRLARNICGDITPPVITITTPPQGKRYARNAVVPSDWTCVDPDSGVLSMSFTNRDAAATTGGITGSSSGVPIDTTVAAGQVVTKSFTVECEDNIGNVATPKTHTYIVDDSPPQVVIDSPVDGATYNRNSAVPVTWHCEDGDENDIDPGQTYSTPPGIQFADTVMPLGGPPIQKTFTARCTDTAGNWDEADATYTVEDQNPPTAAISSPLDGARFPIGKAVNAGWSCSDPDGDQDIDQNASYGTLPVGQQIDTTGTQGQTIAKTFFVHCQDLAGNPGDLTHTYYVDGNPPIVTITTPADGGTYPRGSTQPADWSCTDPDGPQDVKSQVATAPVGTPINTSTMGQKTFSVTCADQAGNSTTKVVTYTVIGGPPSVTITIPANGATFEQGQVVSPSYSCSDPDGDLKSCVREGATGPLDTSKGGTFKLTVNAEDAAGNKATKTHTYTVKAKGTVAGTGTSPNAAPGAKKACKSRRQFRIRVKKLKGGHRAVSATVFVNGKKTATRRGKRITAIVTLKGLKKGRYTVRINVKYSNGRTLKYTRRFKTCTPKGK